MSPIARAIWPLLIAVKSTASSGSVVPKETSVNPMTAPLKPTLPQALVHYKQQILRSLQALQGKQKTRQKFFPNLFFGMPSSGAGKTLP